MNPPHQPSRNWLVFGCENEPEPLLPLRAGPLRLLFDRSTGFVRRICMGDREVLRGIYAAVRDRNWGTVLPQMVGFESRIDPDSFLLAFEAVCRDGDIHFVWKGRIHGTAAGEIQYDFDGEARSTFWRNRIGFCVLHPIRECAGALARQIRADGSVVECRFPNHIEPQIFGQSSFRDMRAVAHETAPGLWAEVEFAGDVFEMEDQRNWTDASFKTYGTPLALPFPVEIKAGTRVRQRVTLRLRGQSRAAAGGRVEAATADSNVATFPLTDAPSAPLPRIGLGMATHGQPLGETAIARLRALRLAHLRVDLRFSAPDWPTAWDRAVREAAQLGLGLELALHLPPQGIGELEPWRRQLQRCPVPLVRVLALREGEAATSAATLSRVRELLGKVDVPLGAGSDANFCELNREQALGRLAHAGADFYFWSGNPQVHAFDHLSVIETLEALPDLVATARSFAAGKPLVVSPITLKPRFNAVATAPAAANPNAFPASVDPRQFSLFAAAWTLGSLAAFAQAGVESLTFYETTGWRGVMEPQSGSIWPERFPPVPGAVSPLYHLLLELAGASTWVPLQTDLRFPALVARDARGRRRVLLGNLTAQEQRMRLLGLGSNLSMRLLGADQLLSAMNNPEEFQQKGGEHLTATNGILELSLGCFGVARLEWGS